MRCGKAKKLLGRYLDGEIRQSELERLIEEHLEGCSSCRKEFEGLLSLRKILSSKERIKPGVSLYGSIREKISEERTSVWKRDIRLVENIAKKIVVIPLALAVLLMLIIFRETHLNMVEEYLWGDLNFYELLEVEASQVILNSKIKGEYRGGEL